MGLITGVLIFLANVLSSLLANELKEWSPRITKRLIKCAVAHLPQGWRERFEEEWTSHIADVPGDISKVIVALGLLPAAFKMSSILSDSRERAQSDRLAKRPATVIVDGVIFCDAPVALPAHRMLAAAVDASIVLVGLGIFLAVFYISGGQVVINDRNIPLLLGVVMLLEMFYKLLWCLGNGDTAGMRITGLRLVDFAGQRPQRQQRVCRDLASWLSFFSAGLGLLWVFVDEETLAWHDHISKTFPTLP